MSVLKRTQSEEILGSYVFTSSVSNIFFFTASMVVVALVKNAGSGNVANSNVVSYREWTIFRVICLSLWVVDFFNFCFCLFYVRTRRFEDVVVLNATIRSNPL